MVIDPIGIFEFKGSYCMLAMIYWLLQTLSVIPRGSWGDVVRCFTMIRWLYFIFPILLPFVAPSSSHRRRATVAIAAAAFRNLFRSSRQGDSVCEIFIGFLVQADKGVENLVVDRIRRQSSRSTVEVPIRSWNWSEPDLTKIPQSKLATEIERTHYPVQLSTNSSRPPNQDKNHMTLQICKNI
ncbi:hypothetical protein F511_18524 [Dorcoceras hygrometricum]|uniref:Uncharacterized protein n=1 Tax=Dorcoceras hygrometricum TaxID=472368 RepID=A0A2Z7BBW7_9LAMI|nr:hypothetical protein F511_18524 [Dorcoceras hygrometricum]